MHGMMVSIGNLLSSLDKHPLFLSSGKLKMDFYHFTTPFLLAVAAITLKREGRNIPPLKYGYCQYRLPHKTVQQNAKQ